ncbi:MAG: AsmA family protein [Pseudomonadota bacterium]
MQTTLLGLGIAIILALVAALVGPYFVNWSEHRAFFETEASRLIGLQVRVNGPINVSILPFPSAKLESIEIGPAGEASRLKARSLGMELGLGPLMRGEIRAVEIKLAGPEFSVGLNSLGYIDWPNTTLEAETLSIDKLIIEDGRVVLTDAASNSRLVLDKLWFSGDVKSLVGPFRGEGAFVSSGALYGYKVAAGRMADEGMRVKLNIDTTERPLTIETDGTLAFERFGPRFEGSVTLARLAGTVLASGKTVVNEPWRLIGKVKANSQSALFEQVAFQYGAEERAARLTGAAEFKFGQRPRLQGALSARQVDLDRLIATPEMPRRQPLAAIQSFAEIFSRTLQPSFPVALAVSVDAVTLGGSNLQNVGSDLRSDGIVWHLDKLEFRAPGFTQVSLSGRLDPPAKGLGFVGSASVDANDPKMLVSWLAGKPGNIAAIKPWQIRGDIILSADRIAAEKLKTDFERGSVEGRVAYVWPKDDRPARLEAELSAAELDLDSVLGFGDSAFSGLGLEWPREVSLALEAGRARIAGFEARQTTAKLEFDPAGIAIEKLSIADFGNAAIEARGQIVTTSSPGGNITVDIDAKEMNGIVALADKFASPIAEPLRHLASRQKTAKLRIGASLENTGTNSASGKLAVSGGIGAARINLSLGVTGKPEAFAVTDLRALAATDVKLDASLEADDGSVLLPLIGLDRFVVSDKRPARLNLAAIGPLSRELRFDGMLTAGPIDATGKGTIRLPADQPAALDIDQLAGTIGGSKVKGKLAVRYAGPAQVEGTIEADSIDAPALVGAVMGIRSSGNNTPVWSFDPFSKSATDIGGRIELKAERAAFSPRIVARNFRSAVRFSPLDVVFDQIGGEIGGGRLDGRLAFVSNEDGLSARGRVALSGAQTQLLFPGDGKPPVTGKLALSAEVEGAGRSPAAFIGSLSGQGLISLEGAQLSGLNPQVFNAVMRAVDIGIPTDPNRIREFVATSLDMASLPVPQAEAALTISGGQVRISNIATRATGADLAASANVNLTDGALDAQLTLNGSVPTGSTASATKPVIFISLKGALPDAKRTIDTNALANWLALRAVEQQSQKVEQMEKARREAEEKQRVEEAKRLEEMARAEEARREASAPSTPPAEANGATGTAPPLPPVIKILPPPKPRVEHRPTHQQQPQQAEQAKPAAPKPLVGRPLDLLGAQ